MDAHYVGAFAPGLAAPVSAANPALAGAASVVADADAPAGLNPQKESAQVARTTQSREHNEQADFATGAGADMALHTPRAALALRGYGLRRSHSDDGSVVFCVNRWGMVRGLRNIAAVRAFAEQSGQLAELDERLAYLDTYACRLHDQRVDRTLTRIVEELLFCALLPP